MKLRTFLTIALLLVSTLVVEAQQRNSTYNNLVLAKQAMEQGSPGRAKELVDRAASVARSPQDWFDVSNAYELRQESRQARLGLRAGRAPRTLEPSAARSGCRTDLVSRAADF